MKFGVASLHSCLPPTASSECPRHKNNTEQKFHLKLLRNALKRETFGLQLIPLDKKDGYTWKKQHAGTRPWLACHPRVDINKFLQVHLLPSNSSSRFLQNILET